MKPFTFKTILPATILALLPFGTQAGAAPFTFSTTAPDQARGGLEDVDFKMRKAERNWWQPRKDDGSNSNSSSNSNSNSSSNSSDDEGDDLYQRRAFFDHIKPVPCAGEEGKMDRAAVCVGIDHR